MSNVPSETVGLFKAAPVKRKFKDGAVPYSVTAQRVSVLLLSKVKEKLYSMVNCGVIEDI